MTSSFRASLDSHLLYRTTLVGSNFTYADLFVRECVGYNVEKELINLKRWCDTIDQIFKDLEGMSKLPAAPSPVPAAPVAVTVTATADATTSAPASASASASGSNAVPQASIDSNDLLKILASHKIPSVGTYSHPLSKTVDELVTNCPLSSLPGSPNSTHTKNLLLRDKKAGLYYVCARPTADTHAKTIASNLGVKANFRMADVKYLNEHLKVEHGCLGPMAVWNDKVGVGAGEGGPEPEGAVKLVMDSKLKSFDVIYSHPGRCDWSTGIESKALFQFVEKSGHKIIWMDFDEKKAAEGEVGGE